MKRGCDLLILFLRIKIKRSQRAALLQGCRCLVPAARDINQPMHSSTSSAAAENRTGHDRRHHLIDQ